MTANRVAYRTCPLCEATCGLEIHLDDDEITLIRGDKEDVFSRGFLCPKGTALKGLELDPDRLRKPQVRHGDTWHSVSWDDAFAEVERGLQGVIDAHGRDAIGVYMGNPNAHNLAGMIYNRVLNRGIGTSNVFSASTVDQMPKHVSAGLMFGTAISIPLADVDRTDYLLILGANPFVSNGSLLTAPDMPGRLRALRARGGRFVVVDPRRTKTAEEADEHLAIRPGTDAHFLFGIVNTLINEGLVSLGAAEGLVEGFDEVVRLAAHFPPEIVENICGIEGDTIRRVARDLAGVKRAAVYGRIGTCTQEFGTISSWLVDVVNTLSGNLDREGGAMFARPAIGGPTAEDTGTGPGFRIGRRESRVRGLPEALGELPVATMVDEMETSGDGQIRALVCIAGNPVLSTPDSGRLDRALAGLDFMVALDIYRNETTRHANVILPAPRVLAKSHYDLALYNLAIRTVANYSPPIVELGPDELAEWETMCRLTAIVTGQGSSPAAGEVVDDFVLSTLVQSAVKREGGIVEGRDADELTEALSMNGRRGPERVLDFMLRTGPYGDGFDAPGRKDGLSLAVLEANPHGVDLGPMEPRLPGVLRTPSGKIELAPAALIADTEDRLLPSLERPLGGLVLVGRRDLRSNNSWMHNVEVLVKGKPRCTLHVHPDDASRLGLVDGSFARVRSVAGELEAPVEITDAIRPGVVSLPHGWGHVADDISMATASRYAGVNTNVLTDGSVVDALSGNAILNGIPVDVEALVPLEA